MKGVSVLVFQHIYLWGLGYGWRAITPDVLWLKYWAVIFIDAPGVPMFVKVSRSARARDRQTFLMRKSVLLMYRGLRVWKHSRQPACNTFFDMLLAPFQHAFLQVGLPAHRTTIFPASHMQKPLGSDVPQLFCWGIENPLSRQHSFSQASIVRILLSWHSLPFSVGFWGRAC